MPLPDQPPAPIVLHPSPTSHPQLELSLSRRRPSEWQRLSRALFQTPHGKVVSGLGFLYIAELVLSASLHQRLDQTLAWSPSSPTWTLVTWPFVQGPGSAISVLLWMYMLYQFLPRFQRSFGRARLIEMVAAGAFGLLNGGLLTGLLGGQTTLVGWTHFSWVMFVYFGLWRGSERLSFFGLFQFEARWLLWGPLGVFLLFALAGLSTGTWGGPVTQLGAWLGAYAWWNVRGPGARTRTLRSQGRKVENAIRRFTVHQGGKTDDENRPGGDDVWH